jgi:hypothetical protein
MAHRVAVRQKIFTAGGAVALFFFGCGCVHSFNLSSELSRHDAGDFTSRVQATYIKIAWPH